MFVLNFYDVYEFFFFLESIKDSITEKKMIVEKKFEIFLDNLTTKPKQVPINQKNSVELTLKLKYRAMYKYPQ